MTNGYYICFTVPVVHTKRTLKFVYIHDKSV